MNALARIGGVTLAVVGLLIFALGIAWVVMFILGAGAAGVSGVTSEDPGSGVLAGYVLLLGTVPGIGVAISGLVTGGLGAGLYLLADIELHLRRLPEVERPAQVAEASLSPRQRRRRLRQGKKRWDPVTVGMFAVGAALVAAVLAVVGYGAFLERRNDARDRERAAEWERARQAEQPSTTDQR